MDHLRTMCEKFTDGAGLDLVTSRDALTTAGNWSNAEGKRIFAPAPMQVGHAPCGYYSKIGPCFYERELAKEARKLADSKTGRLKPSRPWCGPARFGRARCSTTQILHDALEKSPAQAEPLYRFVLKALDDIVDGSRKVRSTLRAPRILASPCSAQLMTGRHKPGRVPIRRLRDDSAETFAGT